MCRWWKISYLISQHELFAKCLFSLHHLIYFVLRENSEENSRGMILMTTSLRSKYAFDFVSPFFSLVLQVHLINIFRNGRRCEKMNKKHFSWITNISSNLRKAFRIIYNSSTDSFALFSLPIFFSSFLSFISISLIFFFFFSSIFHSSREFFVRMKKQNKKKKNAMNKWCVTV